MNFDIYQTITDKIISQFEQGQLPWLKPWKNSNKYNTNAILPYNGLTGKNYSGMNILLLGCNAYTSNAWYTFRQVSELKGTINKGEKSTMIVFWQFVERTNDKGETENIPFLKYYNVFNYEQCANLPEPKQQVIEHIPYTSLDLFVKELGIGLNHGGNSAFYSPALDSITMPLLNQFISPEHYHATLLHELTHATGHSSRCNRDFKNRFGSEAYAFEELIAELGSAFLSPALGVAPMLQHNTNYIASWLKVLRNDKKAIITASSQAQKACVWVLQSGEVEQQTEKAA